MSKRQFKFVMFVLEGMNSFAAGYFSCYIFFLLQREYRFTNQANLGLAAMNGAIYAISSVYGGKFAQRRGYFTSLKVGFGIMVATLLLGAIAKPVSLIIGLYLIWTFGVCFTWPTLEALVTEGEKPQDLPRMVGIYNVVWAGMWALAFFIGGALFEQMGSRSIYWLPALIHIAQLGMIYAMERKGVTSAVPGSHPHEEPHPELNPRPIARTKLFQRLAWVANPFAYMAANSVVPLIPSVAQKFGLAPALAGVVCSLWGFVRLLTFVGLWLWPGWHYRFSWFLWAYLLLGAGFGCILGGSLLSVMVLGQIFFGVALGLIYYSSLFYSMDASSAKGEHGGVHEAVIGLGTCLGPGMGAVALGVFPQNPRASVTGVGLLLGIGLIIVLVMKWRCVSRPVR